MRKTEGISADVSVPTTAVYWYFGINPLRVFVSDVWNFALINYERFLLKVNVGRRNASLRPPALLSPFLFSGLKDTRLIPGGSLRQIALKFSKLCMIQFD